MRKKVWGLCLLGMLLLPLFGLTEVSAVETEAEIARRAFRDFLGLMEMRYYEQSGVSEDDVINYFGEPNERSLPDASGVSSMRYWYEDDGRESSLNFMVYEDGMAELLSAEFELATDFSEVPEMGMEAFQQWVDDFMQQDLYDIDALMAQEELTNIRYSSYGFDGPILTYVYPMWELALYWPTDSIYFYSFIPPVPFGEALEFEVSDIEDLRYAIDVKGQQIHVDELRDLAGDNWVISMFMESGNLKYEWFGDDSYYLSATIDEAGYITHINYFTN